MITIGLVWLGSAFALDRYGRRGVPEGNYDAIIVLGAKVYDDGRASLTLVRRAKLAARLFHAGHADKVICTGGLGTAPIAEGDAAKQILVRAGVPAEQILVETQSTSTEENAQFAAELGEFDRVLLATDAFHAFRSERVFAKHFEHADAVGTVGRRSLRIKGAIREVFAVAAYGVLGRL